MEMFQNNFKHRRVCRSVRPKGKSLHLWARQRFLSCNTKITNHGMIGKLGFVKIKDSCSLKGNPKKMKIQSHQLEKIFAFYINFI